MAGKIPHEFIDDLLARIDIVTLVQRFIPLKKSGREFAACCPFHGEKTPSFYVSPQKQFYHCFGCGAHGTAIGFLMDYANLNFPEAITHLAEEAGLTVPQEPESSGERASTQIFAALSAAEAFYRQQLRLSQPAIQYLQHREIDGVTARDFGLGWAPVGPDALGQALRPQFSADLLVAAGLQVRRDDGRLHDRFRGRVMFPIRDRRGRVLGFGGRLISSGEPKYLNSPETAVFHKGETVYGLFEARRSQARLEELVVVEGYMDVVALARAGFGRTVACMGTALTRQHLELLFRQVNRLILCFDGDGAGRRAAERALEQALPLVQGLRELRFLLLPEGEDPDSLVRREGGARWEQRVQAAHPLSDALVQLIADHYPLSDAEGRTRFAHAAMKRVSLVLDPVLRDQLLQYVAEQIGSAPQTLGALLAEPKPLRQAYTQSSDAQTAGLQVSRATPAGKLDDSAYGLQQGGQSQGGSLQAHERSPRSQTRPLHPQGFLQRRIQLGLQSGPQTGSQYGPQSGAQEGLQPRLRSGPGGEPGFREEINSLSTQRLWSALFARIVQRPYLAWHCPEIEALTALQHKASPILVQLLDRIAGKPDISPAQLLEGFRAEPWFARLESLAAIPLEDEEDALCLRVAQDAANRLLEATRRQRIVDLTSKTDQLTTEEIAELRRLQRTLQKNS